MKLLLKKILCFVLLVSSFGFVSACSENLSKIEVINPEKFESIEYGGVINWNNLQLKATYSNGKIITYNYSEIKKDLNIDLGDFKSTKVGEYSIELTYKDKSCSIDIEVQNPVISGIGIDRRNLSETINIEKVTNDFKADFINKVSVRAYKTDGSSVLLSKTEYSIVNYDYSTNSFLNALNLDCLNEVGEHWFAVIYENFTPKVFAVRVKLGDENGFILDLGEIDQAITIGEIVDFSKVKVYATFTDGRRIQLDSTEYSIDYSTFNNMEAGDYTIKVSYKHYLDKSFEISVSE